MQTTAAIKKPPVLLLLALTCYNEALIWAENNSLQLTQAIANRAFVWLKLEKFSLALSDLEKVLSFENYPKNSLFKIYQRLATVFQNLGQSGKSVENFTLFLKGSLSFVFKLLKYTYDEHYLSILYNKIIIIIYKWH